MMERATAVYLVAQSRAGAAPQNKLQKAQLRDAEALVVRENLERLVEATVAHLSGKRMPPPVDAPRDPRLDITDVDCKFAPLCRAFCAKFPCGANHRVTAADCTWWSTELRIAQGLRAPVREPVGTLLAPAGVTG